MADEVRLIDAEKLKRKLIEGDGHDDDRFTEGYNCAVNDIKGYIDEMPTIEAVIREQYCPDDDGSCSKAGVDLREMLDEIEGLDETEVQSVKHGR